MSRKREETEPALVTPGIEALADAVRGDVGPAGAERALAAFRSAHNTTTGNAPLRRRRRDDWRPDRRGFPTRVSVRAALGGVLAGVTLGGVALAAGTGVIPNPLAPAGSPEPRPGVQAPRTPGGHGVEPDRTASSPAPAPSGTPTPSGSPTPHGPAPGNRAALCYAWAKGNGKHEGTAFRRLAEAVGGGGAVDAYCAASPRADEAMPPDEAATPSAPGKPAGTPAAKSSKDHPAASTSHGRSAQHTPGAGQRP